MGMASLNIDILGMKFSNPIFTAAGPGAKDGELCVTKLSYLLPESFKL